MMATYAEIQFDIDDYGESLVAYCHIDGCTFGQTLDYPYILADILAVIDAHECGR